MITDQTMPDMTGVELPRASLDPPRHIRHSLHRLQPHGRRGVDEGERDKRFVMKPYKTGSWNTVRKVLDGVRRNDRLSGRR